MGPQNWLVIVSRSSAKIFEVSRKPDAVTWLQTIKNPLGSLKNRIMTDDKPGLSRGKFAGAKSPHCLVHERSPHEDAAIGFAKKISAYLKSQKQEKSYLALTIAAEPHMMGLIKKAMDQARLKVVIRWLHKDLEKMSTPYLEELMFKSLPKSA